MSSSEYVQTIKDKYRHYSQLAWEKYEAWPKRVKIVFWLFSAVQVLVAGVTLYLGPARIFEALAEYARDLRAMPFGWAVIIAGIMLSGIPPVVSIYGMLISICGFAYYESVFKGWLVATLGCLAGSAFSFVLCRLFIGQFRQFLDQSRHVNALSRVIDEKGLPLIALVRLAPISFAYSNLLFASIPSVDLPRFLVGTLAITPKLALHVFIGNRMYQFADPTERQKLDKTGKILNGLSIAVGTLIGAGVGVYVWRLTMQYVNAVELKEGDEDLEDGLLSGRSSADLRRSREFAAYTPPRDDSNRHPEGEVGEEMSLEDIDRELQAQGVAGGGSKDEDEPELWGDQFSDFDELEQGQQEQKQSRLGSEDGEATPRPSAAAAAATGGSSTSSYH